VRGVAPVADTVILPLRGAPVFAVTRIVNEPLPVPLAGVTVSHEVALLDTVHDAFEVTVTDRLFAAFDGLHVEWLSVSVADRGEPCIFAWAPAPTELTALTLKVWVPAARFVNVCPVVLWACIHPPLLRATSYLIIAAPPLLDGAVQLRVT